MDLICSAAELEGVVGARRLPVMMKTIDRLDPHCVALLARSPSAVLGYADGEHHLRTEAIGGAPGFAEPLNPSRLRLPLPSAAAPGTGAALLVLLPGWRETLRINGHLDENGLVVREAFLHCGKAVIRSDLWGRSTGAPNGDTSAEDPELGPEAAAFLATAPFATVTSRDRDGNADTSPRGDLPGVLRQIGPTTIAIADRPGNKRTDTFHNLVDDPEVAILAMTPGDERTLEISGTATISTDPALRESMSERNRAPKVVLLVEVTRARLAASAAVRDARLWNRDQHIDPAELPRPSAIWADHVKLNGTRGTAARAVRAAANERLLRTGLSLDYKQNL
ncbi:pyridoxamine 5'-phosphate oxidase family protein [Saccharopolyspora tripterygii]